MLESLAWNSKSPLWEKVEEGVPLPTCEEVFLPSQLDKGFTPTQIGSKRLDNFVNTIQPPPKLLGSPINIHRLPNIQRPVPMGKYKSLN